MKILANDGIDAAGKKALESIGCTVITDKVAQENLATALNTEAYDGILVRSATTVRKDLIDACPNLKFIGRGGVGTDNIDVEYARNKNITVFNTPSSSSQAVAELVMSAMFAIARGINDSARLMPESGSSDFSALKKKYSKGFELRDKTLGIVGFGRIGQWLARYAFGCGMKVVACDNTKNSYQTIDMEVAGNKITADIPLLTMDELLSQSDFISLHVPKQEDGSAVIGKREFSIIKQGAVLLNTSRGGTIDEEELLANLNSGHIRAAYLDVFTGEPKPNEALLKHPMILSTPHIGGSTVEAQARIGLEIAANVKKIMQTQPI